MVIDPILKSIAPPGDESNRAQYFMFFSNQLVQQYEITNRNYFNIQDEVAAIINSCDWIDQNTLIAIVEHLVPHTNQVEPFCYDSIVDKESALGALATFRFGVHAMGLKDALDLVLKERESTVKLTDKL